MTLSQWVQRRYAMELMADHAGGLGYLLNSDVPAFCRDLRRVTQGGTVLDPEVGELMMKRSLRDDQALDSLSPRRREVLTLIAEGLSNAAIARRLHITEMPSSSTPPASTLGLPADGDEHRRVLAVIHYLGR